MNITVTEYPTYPKILLTKLKTCKRIKSFWDQRKLSNISLEYNKYGLCMLMVAFDVPNLRGFMRDIGEAAANKDYFSGDISYPLKSLDKSMLSCEAYWNTCNDGTTFDRRTKYGQMRYQLLCDLIEYYEEELTNHKLGNLYLRLVQVQEEWSRTGTIADFHPGIGLCHYFDIPFSIKKQASRELPFCTGDTAYMIGKTLDEAIYLYMECSDKYNLGTLYGRQRMKLLKKFIQIVEDKIYG